jgi:peptidoglycan/xylan/chitin deacetylase (PgdA/CDA1 family)
MTQRLALRIDVDFPVGLDRAVPRMLDRLAAAGCRATFFVVSGRNRPARSLKRLCRPAYRRRIHRLGIAGILGRLSGSLFGSGQFLDSDRRLQVLRRIVAEEHELAVHGYDHAWWADHVWDAPPDRLRREIDLGYAAMREAVGLPVTGWGSPNWRTTEDVLRHLIDRGAPYLADCWGREPFVTVDRTGSPIRLPHLPVTLPSLEGLILDQGADETQAARRALAGHRPGRVDVMCMHDYFEGLLRPGSFDSFLGECERRGVRTVRLDTVGADLSDRLEQLPCHLLRRGPVPGFVGEVSWQGAERSSLAGGHPAVTKHKGLH